MTSEGAMTPDPLQHAREIADAATPGTWITDWFPKPSQRGWAMVRQAEGDRRPVCDVQQYGSPARVQNDVDYIAFYDPPTALLYNDVVEACLHLRSEQHDPNEGIAEIFASLDALTTRLKEKLEP